MANVLANIARVVSATTGTGTLTLGAAVTGFNTFADAGITDGQTVTYAIEDYTAGVVSAREVGTGVFNTAGPTLTRATVYSSTSAGAKINCTGTQQVFITAAKEDFDSFATDLTAHLNDTSDAHDASAISFTPAGNVAATDVQAAIAELDSEKLSTSAAASTYQPLDADLTAIAALSGTNNIYYRSAANTWSSVTVSANLGFSAGTLGSSLGTAATYNVGTSGGTVPLLNAANTFSAAQTITTSASFATNLYLTSTSDDNLAGPIFEFYRNSPSPAANDVMGMIKFLGNNDLGTQRQYGQIKAVLTDPTNGSEDSGLAIVNYQAGAFTQSAYFGLGVYVGSPTGFERGAGTLNAVTLYENGTSLASKYQGLDSELTAIAGLTSAADRLPYFTGSGTAALATFTTAGRNLVDDATTADQRTTLGLGTAATQNTGTSGATIPLLNAVNTWTGAQTFNYQTHTFTWSDDGAGTGPVFNFVRNSASPAIGDSIAGFNWVGKDSAGVDTGYGLIEGIIVDPTNGSEDSRLRFWVYQAGVQQAAMRVGLGFVVGAPTGAEKGAGTINAVAVYDDSVLLCAPVEFMKSGTVNTATWDQYTADYHEPEGVIEEEGDTVEIDLPEPKQEVVGQKDGTLRVVTKTKTRVPVLEEKPVLDEAGRQVGIARVPKRTRTPVPEKLVKRRNDLAHEFKAMLDEGFDPRDPKAYFDKMLSDEALPGLKTKANWVPNEESNAKRTNRIILALELQTAAFKTVYEQVEALKAEVAALKSGK
jgi:hypothetical protein